MKRPKIPKRLKNLISSYPIANKFFTDMHFRNKVSLAMSLLFNIAYALWEVVCGIYYRSPWFAILGFYYVLLTAARLILLREANNREGNEETERKQYRRCGVLLLLMNFVLTGIVVLAVTEDQGSHYAGYLIYVVAAYTFYRVIAATRNLVKNRRFHGFLTAASKMISFVTAMISLLSLEIAMILQFGGSGSFFRTMTVITGTAV
ncbi:MAG: hypothetical protein LUG85_04060, partial [Clostridiales bacterium]|nr:hypothetical protein [Clostridiales bacterium]